MSNKYLSNSNAYIKLRLFFLLIYLFPFLVANSQFIHRSFKAFSFANPPGPYPKYKAFQDGSIFQKGDSFEVVTVFNTKMVYPQLKQLGWSVQLAGVVISKWEVKNINYVVIIFEHSVKNIKTKMTVPLAGPVFFDSDKKEDYENKENKETLQILKNTYSINVGSDGIIAYVVPDKLNPNTITPDSNHLYQSTVPFADEAGMPSQGDAFNMKIALPANFAINSTWITTVQNHDEKRIANYTIKQISENEVEVNYKEEETTITGIKQQPVKEIKNILLKCIVDGVITVDKTTQIIKHYNTSSQTTWTLQTTDAKNKDIVKDSLLLTIDDSTAITVKKLKGLPGSDNGAALKWSKTFKDKFLQGCVKNKTAEKTGEAEAITFCSCVADKLEEKYPNEIEIGVIMDAEFEKFFKDCSTKAANEK